MVWKNPLVSIVAALLALTSATAAAAKEPASKKKFLPAVARGEFDRAIQMISGSVQVTPSQAEALGSNAFSAAEFIDRIRNCYIRAAYGKDGEPNSILAAWMCPLEPSSTNPNRSRVILVRIDFVGDQVRLSDYSQQDSTRPAPPPNLSPAN